MPTPHPRQLVRQAVRTLLVASATAAGERVHATRVVPWRKGQLPAIAVYTLEETVEPESRSTSSREQERTLQLAVECAVQQPSGVDDALDELAWEVERALGKDETLGGTASDCFLSSTEMDVLEDGERLTGVTRLTYTVTYYTDMPVPGDVAPDDFAGADVRYNLGGEVHPDDQAQDKVDVEE